MTVSEASDEALARQAAVGDARAFAVLIERHKAAVYRLTRRCTGDPEAALDLVQESLAAAWLGLGRYDPERPFAAWLRTVTLNKCRDAARRRRVRPRAWMGAPGAEPPDPPDPAPGAEAALIEHQRLQALDRAVAELPHKLKEPLILTAFEGLSQAAAARALGVSVKAVETRVARARRLLQARLALEWRG